MLGISCCNMPHLNLQVFLGGFYITGQKVDQWWFRAWKTEKWSSSTLTRQNTVGFAKHSAQKEVHTSGVGNSSPGITFRQQNPCKHQCCTTLRSREVRAVLKLCRSLSFHMGPNTSLPRSALACEDKMVLNEGKAASRKSLSLFLFLPSLLASFLFLSNGFHLKWTPHCLVSRKANFNQTKKSYADVKLVELKLKFRTKPQS